MPKSIIITFPGGTPKVDIIDTPSEYLTPRDISLASRVMDLEYRKHKIARRRSQEFPVASPTPNPTKVVKVGAAK
jgi:hypothetical protein